MVFRRHFPIFVRVGMNAHPTLAILTILLIRMFDVGKYKCIASVATLLL